MIIKGVLLMTLIFSCPRDNDLYLALEKSGYKYPRYDTHREAVEKSPEGSSVFLLSPGYPDSISQLDEGILRKAGEKKLKLYLEYASGIPGVETEGIQRTQWERCVVSSDALGDPLPRNRILMINDCHFLPVKTSHPSFLVLARVAGYDEAIFGLPEITHPILFKIKDQNMVVSTTCLSNFIRARYAPKEEWKALWRFLLNHFEPENKFEALDWEPTVAPSFSKNESLPKSFETTAFKRAVNWIFHSGLLVQKSRKEEIHKLLKANIETLEIPKETKDDGNGTLGWLEGYASPIGADGNQLQRLPLRADCIAEVAMILALDWRLNHNEKSRTVSENLLNYIYFLSNIHGGVRGDPNHPAYGMISWGTVSPAWEIQNYTDDNARVLLASMAASTAMRSPQWDKSILKALLANLRTTGPQGFRNDSLSIPALEQNGWKYFKDTPRINYSPHHESYMWACYLWAYNKTSYLPFLQKAQSGIRNMMEGYPDKWRWRDNIEKARMVLCLSWLVRVEDTKEHRLFLDKIVKDLLFYQDESGAIREIPAFSQNQGCYTMQTNETYGCGETPIIQKDGDPASDQLYTTGFALLGLHEAYAATRDPQIKKAEDRLAQYLCRIQIRSEKYPYLDGAWFRAFDYKKWEYWASSGDWGWGAWSVESGWCQAWMTSILALRSLDVSLWDFTLESNIKKQFQETLKDVPQE